MKIRTLLDTAAIASCLMIVAGPGAAQVSMQIPEPGTWSTFGLCVGALYLLHMYRRRK